MTYFFIVRNKKELHLKCVAFDVFRICIPNNLKVYTYLKVYKNGTVWWCSFVSRKGRKNLRGKRGGSVMWTFLLTIRDGSFRSKRKNVNYMHLILW